MKIPEKVKIGWREYAVVEDKAITNSDGYELLGRIDYDENEIYLCNQAKPENKIVTLLHEILHGIFYMAGRKENCADEGLIDCLSENLYQVIKDNPKMFT